MLDSQSAWIRVFLSIWLPDKVRDELSRRVEKLRQCGGRIGWVRPENLHLTLHFLGDQAPGRVDLLPGLMDSVTELAGPFDMQVRGVGYFGSPRRPRVIWAGIDPVPDVLLALQRAMSRTLAVADFIVEARPFHPHITLGRVRGGSVPSALTSEVISTTNGVFGEASVRRVSLMRSQLSRDGAVYTTLHRAPLKGAD